MAVKIRVDDLPYQEQQILLNGVTLYVRISYNSAYLRDPWVIDILDSNKDNLLVGKRLTATTNITGLSLDLTDILGGYLFCVNTIGTRTPMNRDNLGTEDVYQLHSYSNQEIEDAAN